jgi:addiction module RelE/StbE family toxin
MTKTIRRHRQFKKNFQKRIARDDKLFSQFKVRVELFAQGMRDAPINDHPPTGKLAGRRAFSITADIRVVYVETDDAFVLIDIGTHAQVYGD